MCLCLFAPEFVTPPHVRQALALLALLEVAQAQGAGWLADQRRAAEALVKDWREEQGE